MIDAQTQETVDQQPSELAVAEQGSSSQASPASPFSQGRVQQEIGNMLANSVSILYNQQVRT